MKNTKNTHNNMQPSMRNKQRGALTAELLMIVAAVITALIFMVAQLPNIGYKFNEMKFIAQANEIAQETNLWKKGRPNFESVDITKVCQETSLSRAICGTSNDGSQTNPFGGDWDVRVNTGSKGLFDIVATIPEDGDRIPSLANSVAPSTRGNCLEASGCSTLATSANSITMTH